MRQRRENGSRPAEDFGVVERAARRRALGWGSPVLAESTQSLGSGHYDALKLPPRCKLIILLDRLGEQVYLPS